MISGVQAGAKHDADNGVLGVTPGGAVTELMQTLVAVSSGGTAGAAAGAGGAAAANPAAAVLTNLLTAGLGAQPRPGTGGSASSVR